MVIVGLADAHLMHWHCGPCGEKRRAAQKSNEPTRDWQHTELCDYCRQDVAGREWVILNRYVVGTSKGRNMVEERGTSGVCNWDIGKGKAGNDDFATGPILCFPLCLTAWLEGKLAETRVHLRRQFGIEHESPPSGPKE
jgi:hypothetical protein